MQLTRLFRVGAFAGIVGAATIFACSSSSSSKGTDGGMGSDGRAMGIDGSSGGGGNLTLGKKCGSAADCPASAPDCIGIALGAGSASPTYCTPECDSNASGKTNGSGQFTSLTPAPNNAACTGAYMGSGTPSCSLLLKWSPMDSPLKPNKSYTGITLGCAVQCGPGNSCAAGMTCNTSVMLCFPS